MIEHKSSALIVKNAMKYMQRQKEVARELGINEAYFCSFLKNQRFDTPRNQDIVKKLEAWTKKQNGKDRK